MQEPGKMEIAMFSVIFNIIAVILLIVIVIQLHDLQEKYLEKTTLSMMLSDIKNSWIIHFALSLFKFRLRIERRNK